MFRKQLARRLNASNRATETSLTWHALRVCVYVLECSVSHIFIFCRTVCVRTLAHASLSRTLACCNSLYTGVWLCTMAGKVEPPASVGSSRHECTHLKWTLGARWWPCMCGVCVCVCARAQSTTAAAHIFHSYVLDFPFAGDSIQCGRMDSADERKKSVNRNKQTTKQFQASEEKK